MSLNVFQLKVKRRDSESISMMLQEKGVEPSALRVKVATVLLSKIQHLTFKQIRHRLKHNNNMISDSALINTLGLFAKHNIINEIFIDSSTVFYDSNTRVHLHFFNTDTGNLADIPTHNVSIFDAKLAHSKDKVG